MSKRKITKDTNSYCSKSPKWTLDSIFSKITTQLGEETEDTSDTELYIDVPKFSEDSHECKSETGNNKKKDSIKSIIKTNKCIVNVSKSGRSRYVCELCFKFKDHTEAKFQPFVRLMEPYCDFQNCKNIFPLKFIKNHAVLEMFRKCLMLKRRQKQKSGCVFQIRMQLFVIELAV